MKWVPGVADSQLHTNNQLLSLTDQLNLGVRALELDTHWVGAAAAAAAAASRPPRSTLAPADRLRHPHGLCSCSFERGKALLSPPPPTLSLPPAPSQIGGTMRIAHCGGLHVPQLNKLIDLLNLLARLFHRPIRWDTETLGCVPSLSSIPAMEQRLLTDALEVGDEVGWVGVLGGGGAGRCACAWSAPRGGEERTLWQGCQSRR